MDNQSYPSVVSNQLQSKFNLLKAKMLEPVRQVRQSRQQNLKNLLTELEKKQSLLQSKRANLVELCQE